MSKQIFIEVMDDPKAGEQVFVDWNKNFATFIEVMVTLQQAIGAVAQEQQKHINLNQKGIMRPDFVPARDKK